jgi:integrase
MATLKLTKSAVAALPFREGQQAFYYDSILPGFGLRIGRTAKTYFAEKRVGGRTRRVTIGRHNHLTCEQARRQAQKHLGAMAGSVDPNREKRALTIRGIVLGEAFTSYLESHQLRPNTVYNYRRVMNIAFGDWLGKPLRDITKQQVLKRHSQFGQCHGPAYANQAMRILRAVYNFHSATAEDAMGDPVFPDNPVRVLSRSKSWFKVPRRETVIRPHELGPWLNGVIGLCHDDASSFDATVRDYLLVLVFTGLRREEAAGLRWDDIDLKGRTLTVPMTKNGTSHMMPLPDFLVSLLRKRRLNTPGEFVFPGTGRTRYLVEPRKQMKKVSESCGVKFCLHDLRRTFISIAESLDISSYAVKRLVNHKVTGDVTAGYVVFGIERLRDPVTRIANVLLTALHHHQAQSDLALSRT